MDKTKIEWTHLPGRIGRTWNPVTGCSMVSPGCAYCYAAAQAPRLKAMGAPGYTDLPWTARNAAQNVVCHENRLGVPLRWTKPSGIFVNSMSDVFHEAIPYEFLLRMFGVMAEAQQHVFLILTKRAERMAEIVPKLYEDLDRTYSGLGAPVATLRVPLPNVWLGVSVENQDVAGDRVWALIDTPAAVRFLSCEPLLGPVDLNAVIGVGPSPMTTLTFIDGWGYGIDWIIVGGESGPEARPMKLDWARQIVRQCQDGGCAVFVKQLGSAWAREQELGGKGGDPDTWPGDLRVRQFPNVAAIADHAGYREDR